MGGFRLSAIARSALRAPAFTGSSFSPPLGLMLPARSAFLPTVFHTLSQPLSSARFRGSRLNTSPSSKQDSSEFSLLLPDVRRSPDSSSSSRPPVGLFPIRDFLSTPLHFLSLYVMKLLLRDPRWCPPDSPGLLLGPHPADGCHLCISVSCLADGRLSVLLRPL